MGRLGFNIVRVKQELKGENVEEGVPDVQENESNESVEVGELLVTLDERNRAIGNLKLLCVTLTAVIVCLCGFIVLTQSNAFQNDQTVVPLNEAEQMQNFPTLEALQGEYDAALNSIREEQTLNCTARISSLKDALEKQLISEQTRRESEQQQAEHKYSLLQRSYETLQTEKEALSSAREIKERQLADLRQEIADLERKVEAGNKKLQSAAQQSRATSTTTPAPRGLFDTGRLRKINDLVKDIESGAAIIDLESFMKKTNDAFRFK